MLKTISWTEFTVVILIATAFYYLTIALLYFSPLLSRSLTKTNFQFTAKTSQSRPDEQNNLFEISSSLSRILKHTITEGGANHLLKQELLYSLQTILKDYSIIIGTPFESAINNLVEDFLEKECSIYLNAEELKGIWKS